MFNDEHWWWIVFITIKANWRHCICPWLRVSLPTGACELHEETQAHLQGQAGFSKPKLAWMGSESHVLWNYQVAMMPMTHMVQERVRCFKNAQIMWVLFRNPHISTGISKIPKTMKGVVWDHHLIWVAGESLDFQGFHINPKSKGCVVKPVFIMVFLKIAFIVVCFCKGPKNIGCIVWVP